MSWISKSATGNILTIFSIVIALIALKYQIFAPEKPSIIPPPKVIQKNNIPSKVLRPSNVSQKVNIHGKELQTKKASQKDIPNIQVKEDFEEVNGDMDFFKTIGVKIILTKDKQKWKEIISYGFTGLKGNTPSNIITARTVAIAKAKANLAHFLSEEINSKKALQLLSTESDNIEKIITSITNKSHITIKGIEVLETKINIKKGFIRVKVRINNNE